MQTTSKKKLLIITQTQFGYHTDSFKYCQYLNHIYTITYLCFDYQRSKASLPNVKVVYISRQFSLLVRNYIFIRSAINEVKKGYDVTLIKYFNGCAFVSIFNSTKLLILNIRSGIISKNKIGRFLRGSLLKIEVLFFKKITIISTALCKKINLKDTKAHILPLGADLISTTKKEFNQFHLLYVGTFSQRKIMDTLRGFHKFYKEYNHIITTTYTIIGSGHQNEDKEMIHYVQSNGLAHIIKIIGYTPHNQLKTYFDTRNIGVSYIPITDFFDCQPPTKTYEYILSGMAVLATSTSENVKIINNENGKLIKDNPDAFYEGLCQMYSCKEAFRSEKIIETASENTWEKIVFKNLNPYLSSMLNN